MDLGKVEDLTDEQIAELIFETIGRNSCSISAIRQLSVGGIGLVRFRGIIKELVEAGHLAETIEDKGTIYNATAFGQSMWPMRRFR